MKTVPSQGGAKDSVVCFDTNIIIYLGNGTLGADVIGNDPICYPSITAIEALGYPNILSAEEQRIKALLAVLTEIPLNTTITLIAIKLRQLKKMSLGDAIVAATALASGAVLWTANTEDFVHIDGLLLHNPLISVAQIH